MRAVGRRAASSCGARRWPASAFGNAGVHTPHGLSYAVAGLVRDFHPEGYQGGGPIVPYGMSVMVNAPRAIGRDALNGLNQDAFSYR